MCFRVNGPRLLKIDNIMYFVSDLEKAANFYEKVLGLKRAWNDQKKQDDRPYLSRRGFGDRDS